MIGHAVQALGVFVLTMALALWAAAGEGAPVSGRVDVPAAASASIAPSKSFAVMQACRNGAARSHGMCTSAAACGAHCALNAAIIPVALGLATSPSSCAGLTTIAEAEGHCLPPDPPPPRAVIIG